MGERGPAPKPTPLKMLQGNPGKRQLNTNEPKFPIEKEVPKAPAFLSKYGKKEWNRIAPMLYPLGLLTEADHASLAAYCQNYHRWVEAEKIIRTKGYTTLTDKGNVIQRPEVGIANTAMKLMKDFAKEFGLTPSSRSSVHIDNPEGAKDPFMEYLKGGRKKNG